MTRNLEKGKKGGGGKAYVLVVKLEPEWLDQMQPRAKPDHGAPHPAGVVWDLRRALNTGQRVPPDRRLRQLVRSRQIQKDGHDL